MLEITTGNLSFDGNSASLFVDKIAFEWTVSLINNTRNKEVKNSHVLVLVPWLQCGVQILLETCSFFPDKLCCPDVSAGQFQKLFQALDYNYIIIIYMIMRLWYIALICIS